MILVAGATGFLGGEICRRLIAKQKEVRGLVRRSSDPQTVERLTQAGVETVVGDLKDRASLDRACKGVDAVITTATTTRSRQPDDSIEKSDQEGQHNLIDAAKAAGVKRFVYVSYSGQIDSDDPLTKAKRTTERRLRDSGMTYTILRPSYFMEAWLSPALGFDFPNARATLYGSGDQKISWISLGDVAEFAVRALDDRSMENSVLELGGPEAVSPNECVKIFEKATGKKFEVQCVPREQLTEQAKNASNSLERSFASLMLNYAKGDEIPMQETLARYPVRMTSVRDYAQQSVKAD